MIVQLLSLIPPAPPNLPLASVAHGSVAGEVCSMPLLAGVLEGLCLHMGGTSPEVGRFWSPNNEHLFLWAPRSSTVDTHSPNSQMGKPSLRGAKGLGQDLSPNSFPQGMIFHPSHHLFLALAEKAEGVCTGPGGNLGVQGTHYSLVSTADLPSECLQ